MLSEYPHLMKTISLKDMTPHVSGHKLPRAVISVSRMQVWIILLLKQGLRLSAT